MMTQLMKIGHLIFVLQLLASFLSPCNLLSKTSKLPLVLVILQEEKLELGERTKGGAKSY